MNIIYHKLHDHKLIGGKIEYRSFSVTGDIRIKYEYLDGDTVLFLKIGPHPHVYDS